MRILHRPQRQYKQRHNQAVTSSGKHVHDGTRVKRFIQGRIPGPKLVDPGAQRFGDACMHATPAQRAALPMP